MYLSLAFRADINSSVMIFPVDPQPCAGAPYSSTSAAVAVATFWLNTFVPPLFVLYVPTLVPLQQHYIFCSKTPM